MSVVSFGIHKKVRPLWLMKKSWDVICKEQPTGDAFLPPMVPGLVCTHEIRNVETSMDPTGVPMVSMA